MTWLVRNPSWALTPGVSESSAIRWAIRVRSAASWTFLLKSWKNPVSSMAW